MKRNILNSPRLLELKRKRHRVFLNKILFSGFMLLVVLAGLSYISRVNRLNFGEIEITSNGVVDIEMIKTSVRKEITGNYFWIFPKTNIFFYPKNSIKNELSDKFKQLKNVELSIKENGTLFVSLTERKALYTWCGSVPLESGSDNKTCYFLDDSGYIFNEAPYFSGEIYFKFYGNLAEETNNPPGFYFKETNFQKLVSFKETLKTMGLKPVALYMLDNEDIKIYLSNKSSLPMGPEIILKMSSDFPKVAENLQAALTTEPLKSDFESKYSSLLYIDLRFGNKVYYKFK